jgi:hypothetical protein
MKAKIIILSILVLAIILVWQNNAKQPKAIRMTPAASIVAPTAEDLSALRTTITDDAAPPPVTSDTPVTELEKPKFQESTGPVELLTL